MYELTTIIQNCCKLIEESNNFKDSNWTETIKIELAKLGEKKGYETCTSTKGKEYEKEWLYDLVWYKENEQRYLIEVPLVVESEWKKDLKSIKFDFEKLLLAKSPTKLMICQANENDQKIFLDYFQEAINVCPFATKNEEYLISILKLVGNDADGFTFWMFQKGENPKLLE